MDAKAAARAEAKKATNLPAQPASATARKKLSFKDQHALETLPKRISALDADIAKLETVLADPALYARDPKAFETATAKLDAAARERSDAEDRWLELEMMREELAAG